MPVRCVFGPALMKIDRGRGRGREGGGGRGRKGERSRDRGGGGGNSLYKFVKGHGHGAKTSTCTMLRVSRAGFGVWGSGFGVWVQGSGFGVNGLVFRVSDFSIEFPRPSAMPNFTICCRAVCSEVGHGKTKQRRNTEPYGNTKQCGHTKQYGNTKQYGDTNITEIQINTDEDDGSGAEMTILPYWLVRRQNCLPHIVQSRMQGHPFYMCSCKITYQDMVLQLRANLSWNGSNKRKVTAHPPTCKSISLLNRSR